MRLLFINLIGLALFSLSLRSVADATDPVSDNDIASWSFVAPPDLACKKSQTHRQNSCKFGDAENNSLSIERKKGNVYEIQAQKTYLTSWDGSTMPAYCVFGGLARREGNEFLIYQNNDQDGAVVKGLKIKMSADLVEIIDDDPPSNSRYCGDKDSLGGMKFKMRKPK